MLVKLISHKSVQRRVLITTLPWILNVVVRIVKVRNAPMNTLHFISNNGFFFVSYFVEKKQQLQNRHGKEKLSL